MNDGEEEVQRLRVCKRLSELWFELRFGLPLLFQPADYVAYTQREKRA